MAHYLFNYVNREPGKGSAPRVAAVECLRVGMWGIGANEPHHEALAVGDLVLVYVGAPERVFVGRAELVTAVHHWTPSEAQLCPDDSVGGVLLSQVEEWDPALPMETVLSHIDPTENAKADFEFGVVRITASEYTAALAAAAGL